ncbi:hypothetical protein VNO80_06013 [Phaseolus coccineus]|uniref:Uncharacterized protein n=1 Tax=Phaseolus coccineus TaxID=3886 RepID=A0AAN9NHB2_PHACN
MVSSFAIPKAKKLRGNEFSETLHDEAFGLCQFSPVQEDTSSTRSNNIDNCTSTCSSSSSSRFCSLHQEFTASGPNSQAPPLQPIKIFIHGEILQSAAEIEFLCQRNAECQQDPTLYTTGDSVISQVGGLWSTEGGISAYTNSGYRNPTKVTTTSSYSLYGVRV